MTVISTQTLTGSSVTFSSIPSGYARLTLALTGVSTSVNTSALRYELSGDGVNYTTPVALGTGFLATSSISGVLVFSDPDADTGTITGAQGQAPTSGIATTTGITAQRVNAGGIKAIRISLASGVSFDAGSMTLSGE